jgi:hypothetical protein
LGSYYLKTKITIGASPSVFLSKKETKCKGGQGYQSLLSQVISVLFLLVGEDQFAESLPNTNLISIHSLMGIEQDHMYIKKYKPVIIYFK